MVHIDLQKVPAVDVHCHPYLGETRPLSPDEFIRKLSLSVIPPQAAAKTRQSRFAPYPGTNMWMQILVNRLARYYGCEPQVEEVVRIRNERTVNQNGYTRELFRDANITALVTDFGYPQPPLNRAEFAAACDTTVWEVYRIEPVMVRLRQECQEFGEFMIRYQEDLREALKHNHIVGLKSIIAYRSGLEIGPKNEQAARAGWEAFVLNERAEAKGLRDYCLHLAMEACTQSDKVMHIHTGVGDGDVVLSKASPKLLLPLLRDPNYLDTKVHLVHGGYPWVEEAAFMVSILPNVYMDISLMNPFAGHGVKRILSHVFEFAPFDKVMYGSDAFTVPEMNWLGVHLFKECFEQVLSEWVVADYMNQETAQFIGEMVLHRNFEQVYEKQIKEVFS